MELYDKIKVWSVISEKMKSMKKQEMEMRVEICEEIINGVVGKPLNVKTSKTISIAGYATIIAAAKTSTKLDMEIYDNIEDDFNVAERLCIAQKPTLIAAKIKLLPEDSSLFTAIYETPSAPALKITYFED